MDKKFQNVFIKEYQIENIDILRYKADMNYYSNMKDFSGDIEALFKNIYMDLDKLISFDSIKAKKYLTSIYFEFIKTIPNDFTELYNNDIEEIIINNKLPKVSNIL